MLFQVLPRCVAGRDDRRSMRQRLGNRVAEVFAGSWQGVATGMGEQPAFLNLINVPKPEALFGNPKISGKPAALFNVGLRPASRNNQNPVSEFLISDFRFPNFGK